MNHPIYKINKRDKNILLFCGYISLQPCVIPNSHERLYFFLEKSIPHFSLYALMFSLLIVNALPSCFHVSFAWMSHRQCNNNKKKNEKRQKSSMKFNLRCVCEMVVRRKYQWFQLSQQTIKSFFYGFCFII